MRVIGDFQTEINYWGDFRAVFDAMYPGVLPADAVSIPEALMADWVTPAPGVSQYQTAVTAALLADIPKAFQLFQITGAPIDSNAPRTSAGETVMGLLSYNILATNEARVELGNIQPYSNIGKTYTGGVNDLVQRYAAEGDVAAAIAPYNTTGQLSIPLVVMHTTLDPIVPYWHQQMYIDKVEAAGAQDRLTALTIPVYGHCKFRAGQQIYAFARMLHAVSGRPISDPLIQGVLASIDLLVPSDPGAKSEVQVFAELNSVYDVTHYRYYLPSVSSTGQ